MLLGLLEISGNNQANGLFLILPLVDKKPTTKEKTANDIIIADLLIISGSEANSKFEEKDPKMGSVYKSTIDLTKKPINMLNAINVVNLKKTSCVTTRYNKDMHEMNKKKISSIFSYRIENKRTCDC